MSFGFGFGIPSQASATGGASLSLNFAGATSLDPKITFTRASTATYTNSAGLIASAAINAPRFDYDPVTLQPKGLLIEEQRTNLCLRSGGMNVSPWTGTDTTATANSIVSPDGGTNASLFTEGSAGTAVWTQGGMTITAGATVTLSIFLKRGNHDWINVLCTDSGAANGFKIWVNVNTGVIGTTGVNGTGTYTSSSIQDVGGGWYRVSLTGITSAANTAANIYVTSSAANNSTTRVSGGTRYMWGAQLEAGAFATSYIPTVAAQVTRAADNAVMTGTNFSSWFNATEGTFAAVFDMNAAPLGTGNKGVYAAYGSASNNILSYASNSAGILADIAVDGGVGQAALSSVAVIAANTVYKDAFAYKLNDFARSLNAATVQTDTSGTVPAGLTEFRIGRDDGAASTLNGHIRTITYWPRRLSNTELQGVTA